MSVSDPSGLWHFSATVLTTKLMTSHHDIPHRKNAAEWAMYGMVLPIIWLMRLKRRWWK